MNRAGGLAPLVLVAALLVVGCGESDEEQAEQTVRDFVTATNERDAEAFCGEIVTRDFLEKTTGAKGDDAEDECRRQLESIKGLEVELVRIRSTSVDGEEATVNAVIRTQGAAPRTQAFRLRKEDGDWRLTGNSG